MVWALIHLVDILLWVFTAGSVLYVVVFALCSLIPPRRNRGATGQASAAAPTPHRFLVLFPAYKEDKVIVRSVETFLQQDYPEDCYHVAVIADHMQPQTIERLRRLPITLLQPDFEKSSKARALQHAMAHFETSPTLQATSEATGQEAQDRRRIVILDADNVVGPDFLHRLDQSCTRGYQAIQCHRTAKNADNDIALLDGVSEEINNTIFRRAHNNVGLSAALIGSGMCFSYQWFSQNVGRLDSAVEDRELEALLALQGIYVKYEEDIRVMDEKVSSQDNFQRQRLRWMTGQVQSLCHMAPHLWTALRRGNANYVDKTLQQMLIPRSILLVLTPLMAIVMSVLALPWSVKWWAMLACLCLALLIAVPAPLRTGAVFSKLVVLPRLVWRMLRNVAHISRNNKEFLHTTHDK